MKYTHIIIFVVFMFCAYALGLKDGQSKQETCTETRDKFKQSVIDCEARVQEAFYKGTSSVCQQCPGVLQKQKDRQ